MTEQHSKPEHTENSEEEVIDFSKLKNKVKGLFNKEKTETTTKHSSPHGSTPSSEHPKSETQDSLSIDFNQVKNTAKKHAKWLIPLACILFAVIVSVYLRTMPQRMPIADQWAENTVTNYYQGLIKQQMDQQYPYLQEQNKQSFLDKEWQNFQKQNKENMDAQAKTLSQQYRDNFKDKEGTLYLLGIDPYYFYRQVYYVLENGYPGTGYSENGMIIDNHRLAPIGGASEWSFHNWFSAQWHKFLNLFGDFPLMYTFFFVGVLFSALTVIPGFFIGKRLTKNNVGGFFTAFLLAVTSFFVARTTGESSDTDVYAVFFPVLIAWLFLEALDAKERKWKLVWGSFAGFTTGLFAFAWSGWWSIALFLLATLIFQIAYTLALHWKNVKTAITSKEIKESALLFGMYALTLTLFVSLFTTFNVILGIVFGPSKFLRLKVVAVTHFWPNIKTTVAELNVVPLSNVIDTLGGKLLFFIAIVGILILLFKKNAEGKREPHLAFLLAIWLGASLFATTKGVRFILQVTPIFAIAVGVCMGFVWYYASQVISKTLKLNKNITQIMMFLLLSLLLISPAKAGYTQAHNSVPSMNDAWYNTLTKIKEEAPENIIITSWWDFGHWFRAVADRPVTFDGGTQTPWGAYWVGRSLLTNDEKATVGIVRMLNCGQNNAFDELDKILNDTPKSVQLLNEIVLLDKNAAIQKLKQEGLMEEQATTVVKYTHCDNPPEDFYITSEDMVGKAGVWGHFGSWDFTRAVMYQKIKKLQKNEAVALLTAEFGVSEEEAEQLYAEIKSTDADRWISPWPGYISGAQGCEKVDESKLRCTGSVQDKNFIINVDLTDHSAKFESQGEAYPNSIVYATRKEIIEKKFSGTTSGFSVVLIPTGSDYAFLAADPLQANSIFTKLFFLQGHGLKCFSKFDEVQNINGGRIITWRVDYSCQQKNNAFFAEE
ncbi:MAG: STT3 domain-containing protein [Nanoarchaeota archaeon]|nr:STT3 domain-containing protein [Nanoarchaeota archaeon]